MNFNLLSYLIFFPAMAALAIWVARTAHRNGEIWLMSIFQDAVFVHAVNNILLIGCYVLNIGYVAIVLAQWEPIDSADRMLSVLSLRFALIAGTLAILHYVNITALLLWSRMERNRHGMAPHAISDQQAPQPNT
ncbi:MAG: hypothetical protein M3R08_05910 [Bacteroidota bacterium]|nr:hypothetical protein [Bacteroidota bacterium]